MTINQNLRDLRQISGLTQEEVASHVGGTRQAVSGYESGRTQPDLEMLAKLARLYQTDIYGILYGRSREQKKLHTLRVAAAALSAALLLLVLVHSCLMLFANICFPVPKDAAMTDAVKQLIQVRFAIIDAWELIQGIARAVSAAGCVVLGVLLTELRRRPPLKKGILAALAFAAGSILCTAPLGFFDTVYGYADYLLILMGIFPSVLLLLAYWGMLALIKK